MPFNTEREHLEHLNHLLHNYPKRRKGKSHKQFPDLEHVLISLDINDFKLDKNQDLLRSIRKELAQHPLRKDGEA